MSETLPLTEDEAVALVTRAKEELRVLLQLTPALQRMGEVLAAHKVKKGELDQREAQMHDLEQRIESAAACCAYDERQASEAMKRKDTALAECKAEERKLADLRTRCGHYERVEELEAAITDKTNRLAELNADLDSLKARHF